MKPRETHLKIVVVFVCGIFCLNFVSGENPVGQPGILSWTCTCAAQSDELMNNTAISNCSSSCSCARDRAGDGTWKCSCSSQQPPQASDNIHDVNCFTACNCTFGSPGTSQVRKTRVFFSKAILAALLLCVVLTTAAVLASVACCLLRKDKLSPQSRIHSFDKFTSWSSRSNLISHRSASFPEPQTKVSSGFSGLKEFIRRLSISFWSRRETLPGVIARFSFVELEQATNKFSNDNLIGVGGSSRVYSGRLSDGRVVAIKKLRPIGGAEADCDFLSEIELISRLNHCHVVPLLGYCSENQGRQSERLLVFEYMSNGNLRDCLDLTQGKQLMDWETRVGVALGVARGLEYLHEAAAPRILHRDIKSTNILLDDKHRAKITDLGMAKRLLSDDIASCSSSPARMLGTFGYFAPEYAIVGKASLKSDVFSFGVVILELITGRQPIHKAPNKGDESLVIWASARLRNSKLVVSELPDPLLKGNFSQEEMQIMAHLARECLQWDPDSRPSMSEVVQILSTIAPDKSRRRSLPASFFMSSPRGGAGNFTGFQRPEGLIVTGDQIQAASERWHSRCPPVMAAYPYLSNDHNWKNAQTLRAAEFAERPIMVASNAQSRRSSGDDAVHLTEPRLERFTHANII